MRATMKKPLLSIWLLVLLAASGPARAQFSLDAYLRSAAQVPDLVLPTEVSALPADGAPRFALHKPDGPGPFPALVLLHQCSGLFNTARNKPSSSIHDWARQAVGKGYVVLVLDSFS